MKRFIFLLCVAAPAFAGSTTVLNETTWSLSTSGFHHTASVNLDAYSASSVTITTTSWARYDSANTASDSATVGGSASAGSTAYYTSGSSEVTITASETFTRSSGQWFRNGNPVGSFVPASGSLLLSDAGPETGTGMATITIDVSWIEAPANTAPTISWVSIPAVVASGETFTISARGADADGNLAQVNVWKDGAPFAFAGGGSGFTGDSGNATSESGPRTVTFTAQAVDAAGESSGTASHSVTIAGPANQPPTVEWISAPGTANHNQSYSISALGRDSDGNLSQVNIWKQGVPFASAGGGDGYQGGSGSATSDSGPQSVTFTAQAFDVSGAASAAISHTITIAAPPPAQFTLTTVAGSGGSVSPGGVFASGFTVFVTAMPDAQHDFAGWSGDAAGTSSPVAVVMNRNQIVQANFSRKTFALTTSASGGGTVTPGGSYPYGTIVTVSATPNALSRFVGWTGDASGTASSVALSMTAARNVQAIFTARSAQTITFTSPANRSVSADPFPLAATASSGLPVSYVVLSGPATLVGGDQLQITGPGAVTIQANQPGDAFYLPAPSVAQTFNAIAAALLKYRAGARVVVRGEAAPNATSVVLEKL